MVVNKNTFLFLWFGFLGYFFFNLLTNGLFQTLEGNVQIGSLFLILSFLILVISFIESIKNIVRKLVLSVNSKYSKSFFLYMAALVFIFGILQVIPVLLFPPSTLVRGPFFWLMQLGGFGSLVYGIAYLATVIYLSVISN